MINHQSPTPKQSKFIAILIRYQAIYKLIGLILILALIYYAARDYMTLEQFKQTGAYLKTIANQNYLHAVLFYVVLYALLVIFALPIILLNLVGGFLFGTLLGGAYSTAAALLGSLVSFCVVRYVVADFIKRRMGKRVEKFNEHITHYGISYLLMLHYSSIVPFFIINSLAALTPLPLRTFVLITILGSFPIALIYAFAGRQLASIDSVSDIFSPAVIASLVLLIVLACAPIVWNKLKGNSLEV